MMREPDARERVAGALDEVVLLIEIAQRDPAQRRQPEQRERHVAQDGVVANSVMI